MKITHFTRQFHPATGGLENFVLALATNQRALGHEVEVVTIDRVFTRLDEPLPAEDEIDGVRIIRVPHWGSRRYPIATAVRQYGRDSDVRHVHAIDFLYDYLGLDNLVGRQPLVVTTHGGFFHTRKYYYLKKIWFATLSRLSALGYDRIIACSPNDYRLFESVAGRRLQQIDNGVDVEKFADAGSRTPRKSIAVIGRFGKNKRLDRVLATMKALTDRDPEWRLEICGVDYDMTRAELQGRIDALGIAGSTTIHYGKTNAEIRDLLGDVSLYVSASEYEGFALAAAEGMTAGLLPVLQADNLVFRDFAERHPFPVMTDFERPEIAAAALIAAHQRLLADPEAVRAEAQRIAGGYAWPLVAARYVAAYEEVAARYRPADMTDHRADGCGEPRESV